MACGSVKQALHRADNHLENGVLDKFLGLKKAQMANVSRFTVHKVLYSIVEELSNKLWAMCPHFLCGII